MGIKKMPGAHLAGRPVYLRLTEEQRRRALSWRARASSHWLGWRGHRERTSADRKAERQRKAILRAKARRAGR